MCIVVFFLSIFFFFFVHFLDNFLHFSSFFSFFIFLTLGLYGLFELPSEKGPLLIYSDILVYRYIVIMKCTFICAWRILRIIIILIIIKNIAHSDMLVSVNIKKETYFIFSQSQKSLFLVFYYFVYWVSFIPVIGPYYYFWINVI